MNIIKIIKYGSILLIIFGIMMVSSGIIYCFSVKRFIATGINTTGVIVDHVVKQSVHDETRHYFPVIKYFQKNGTIVYFESKVGTLSPIYNIGDEVSIIYDRNYPQNAKIYSITIWLFPFVFLLIGITVGVTGLIGLLVISRKTAKRKDG